MKIRINGFGRIAKLVLRISRERKDIEINHINEIRGDSFTSSHTHSYLILAYSDNEKVSLKVGYHYMAKAARRLFGTLLSGLLFMLGKNATIGMRDCL